MSSFSDKVKQVLAAHQGGETGDDPPKGKPKGKSVPALPLLGALASALTVTPLKGSQMTKEVVRDRLRKNMSPSGYGNPVQRVVDAALLNKKDPERVRQESGEAGEEQQRFQLTRQNYWNKYLGGAYDSSEIAPSAYRPTKAKDPNAAYYTSASFENNLPQHLGELSRKWSDLPVQALPSAGNPFKSKDEVKKALLQSAYSNKAFDGTEGYRAATPGTNHLGTLNMDVGEDEHGYYLSYYDAWDLNPFKGETAKLYGQKVGLLNGIGDLSMGIGKPFELYGRVYYDKKTGRRISPPNPKAQTK